MKRIASHLLQEPNIEYKKRKEKKNTLSGNKEKSRCLVRHRVSEPLQFFLMEVTHSKKNCQNNVCNSVIRNVYRPCNKYKHKSINKEKNKKEKPEQSLGQLDSLLKVMIL